MTKTWLIGAGINFVGSVMINLGTNLMKLGHNKKAAVEHRTQLKIPIRRFREWQIGVAFFLAGNFANFVSFAFAAQSLLAALGSIQFVSNVAFASIVLKEQITKTVVGATGCIVTGCVLLVIFGSHASKQFTVSELMELYTNLSYIVYLICLSTSVLVLYSIYKCGKKKMLKVGLSGLSHYWYRLLPVSYALFSGMIGTQSVLFGKTISTLLRVTIGGNSQLESWFTWVIVIFFLFTSTFWISRLNKALKFFPALIIVPTMQISWTFFSIVSGMLYFQEYKDFEMLQGILFTLAVTVVFFGVYLLTNSCTSEKPVTIGIANEFIDEKEQGTGTNLELQTDDNSGKELRIKVGSLDWNHVKDVEIPIVPSSASDSESVSTTEELKDVNLVEIHGNGLEESSNTNSGHDRLANESPAV